jgi:hypothetical protein
MVNPYINVSEHHTISPIVGVNDSEKLGIDFDSAEYSYTITPADEAESPEQAEAMEANHG